MAVLFTLAAVLLSSEIARVFIQDLLAYLTVIFADNFLAFLSSIWTISLLCLLFTVFSSRRMTAHTEDR